MDRAIFPRDAHWYRSAESLRNLLIVAVLTLALTASLPLLGYRTAFTALLRQTHYVAIVGAVLHFSVVLLLIVWIAHSAIVWKKLCNQDKRTAELRQLRQTIFNTTGMTVLILPLAVIAACIPLMMRLVMQLPEFGLVFGFQLIAVVLHSCSINRSAGRLHDSITAAERSAQCTLAA
ncbi:hypothetical protein [Xanthomonas campestris]|uniref:hypothetical protein n=1 Tax=Xanthomonas campestris TaxID=339 RepID=UPI001E4DB774|nr:hypothetical protein [Xanthomonas campestris]MCC5071860.1 hypothetical protein [Xanthomonas campestris pv. plantaginis]MCC5084504.1 hypothetical protein [Xanthomonas campestris]